MIRKIIWQSCFAIFVNTTYNLLDPCNCASSEAYETKYDVTKVCNYGLLNAAEKTGSMRLKADFGNDPVWFKCNFDRTATVNSYVLFGNTYNDHDGLLLTKVIESYIGI